VTVLGFAAMLPPHLEGDADISEPVMRSFVAAHQYNPRPSTNMSLFQWDRRLKGEPCFQRHMRLSEGFRSIIEG
jgi:hypothetical protein